MPVLEALRLISLAGRQPGKAVQTPALRGWRHKGQKFKVILSYVVFIIEFKVSMGCVIFPTRQTRKDYTARDGSCWRGEWPRLVASGLEQWLSTFQIL